MSGDDSLVGGDGDDTIWGGAGNDYIVAGGDASTFGGEWQGDGTGNTLLLGGIGNDSSNDVKDTRGALVPRRGIILTTIEARHATAKFAAGLRNFGVNQQVELRGKMDEKRVGDIWNANAATWAAGINTGADALREILTVPIFLESFLPDLANHEVHDLGCAEGVTTRHIARSADRSPVPPYSRDIHQRTVRCGVHPDQDSGALSFPRFFVFQRVVFMLPVFHHAER